MLGFAFLALLSCPNPLTKEMLLQAKDATPPSITILSPADGSSYAAMVIVTGKVDDSSTPGGNHGQVKKLFYEISPAYIPGSDISFDAAGAFTFQFPTQDSTGVLISGPIVITITAEDWNGNRFSASFTLLDGGGIPSFKAVPGDHQVTLTWDPVPLATSYTLLYTTNGSVPSESFGKRKEGVQSPLTLDGFLNGNMHVFLLQAHSSQGEDNWSGLCKAIPLNSMILAPVVSGEYGRIRVEWSSIPATDEFTVFKSNERNGTYFNISGAVKGNFYLDAEVKMGTHYYYQIAPALSDVVKSEANPGEACPFPPAKVDLVGRCSTVDARGIAVNGRYAYVADCIAGLKVIDVSDPKLPFQAGGIDTTYARNVALDSRGYAYLADSNGGLRVIDVSEPFHPVEVGNVVTSSACGVALKDTFAYIADYDEGLIVVAISDPRAAHRVKTLSMPHAWEIAVSGDCAYIASDAAGLTIIDITDPADPQIVVSLGTYQALGIAVQDGYAYIADSSAGLKVIDVSDASNPQLMGSFDTFLAQDIEVRGRYAYIADWNQGLKVVDISNPTSPFQVAVLDTYQALGVSVYGNYVYVADYTEGLKVVCNTNPSSPEQIGSLDTYDARAVALNGTYIYAADFTEGLKVIDVADPRNPLQVAAKDTFMATDVAVSGHHTYLTDTNEGLLVFDISIPFSPLPVGSIRTYNALGLALLGNYAYVADSEEGLKVIDISNPGAPTLAGSLDTSNAVSVAVGGKYVFVADYTAGLKAIDVSEPTSPFEVKSWTTFQALDVAVSGSHAFVTTGASLVVIDINNLESTPGSLGMVADSVTVSGSYAYIGCQTWGFKILDISNPRSPIQVGSFDSSWAFHTVARGRYAYVADHDEGLKVIQLVPPD